MSRHLSCSEGAFLRILAFDLTICDNCFALSSFLVPLGIWLESCFSIGQSFLQAMHSHWKTYFVHITSHYPPASEASREVANLTWRKNPHPPVYGVKEFVCLSVCYEFRPQLSQDWRNRMGWNFLDIFVKKCCPKIFFSQQGAGMALAEAEK